MGLPLLGDILTGIFVPEFEAGFVLSPIPVPLALVRLGLVWLKEESVFPSNTRKARIIPAITVRM
jgi:hypothetical protein